MRKDLLPLVIGGVAGGELAAPIDGESEPPHLRAHFGDVFARPLRGVNVVFNRGVFGGQPEGVPPHRLHHARPAHHLVAGDHVADGVVPHVSHVESSGGVGEHGEAVKLPPRPVVLGGKGSGGVPLRLNAPLNLGMWIMHDRRDYKRFCGREGNLFPHHSQAP